MQKQKAFVKQLSDAIDACYKAEDAASRHLQKAFSLRQRLRACSRPGAFGAFHDAGLPWVEPGVLAIHAQRITGSLTACQSELKDAQAHLSQLGRLVSDGAAAKATEATPSPGAASAMLGGIEDNWRFLRDRFELLERIAAAAAAADCSEEDEAALSALLDPSRLGAGPSELGGWSAFLRT